MILEFEREKIALFFHAIKGISDEGVLHIRDNKLEYSSSDVAGVSFIEAEYKIDTPNTFTLGIDPMKYYSIINALKTKMITIDFSPTSKVTGGKLNKEINNIDERVIRKNSGIPPLTFPVIIEVPANDFIDVLETIEKAGIEEGALPTKAWLEYNKTKFTIYSINESREKTVSEFDIISTEKGNGTTHKSGYGFDYLLKIAKIIKKLKVDNIKLHVNTDYPCKIEVDGDILSFVWYLAPRIEED